MIITTTAYPRAALIGNPSDGYNGKTIAFIFDNYRVQVQLYESPELEILPADRDHSRFSSMKELAEDVKTFGYYGGVRLIKATLKHFHDYCTSRNIILDNRNFTIRYSSTIPIRLGLAGSSAIIAATTRALFSFYGVAIPKPLLPTFLLSVETEELAISAGLQDRVAQTYGGLIYMDFAREHFERQGYGVYENLPIEYVQNIYVAFRTNLAEGSEILHNNMRGRYQAGDPDILKAVESWAELSVEFRETMEKIAGEYGVTGNGPDAAGSDSPEDAGESAREGADRGEKKREYGRELHTRLSPLINENYDIRHAHLPINPANHEMVMAAREVGASAKFTGSGGAIVGTYADEGMLKALRERLSKLEIEVLIPHLNGDGFGG